MQRTRSIAALEGQTNLINSAVQPADIANLTPTNDVPDYEMDVRALKTHHYDDADITITPESEFGFDPATGTITNYTGTGANLVIPFEIGGYPVLAVADSVFLDKTDITNAVGPRTLISFNGGAFYGCTGLISISLPSVTTFGSYAFGSCAALTTISLPSVTTFGIYAFTSCDALTTISLPSVTTFGIYAFTSCAALTTISLPSVTTFGDYAFIYCDALTTINYASSQPTLGTNPFVGSTNVTNYVLNAEATGWGDTFGGRPVVFPAVTASSVSSKGVVDIDGALTGTTATFSGVVKGATATESNHLERLDQLASSVPGLEADTLATVAARGGFAGTETIGPLRVNTQYFGENSGSGATSYRSAYIGYIAGKDSSGDYNSALGVGSGQSSIMLACSFVGYNSGNVAIATNSSAFGNYSGYRASGNTRLYIGVYPDNPEELDGSYIASDIDIYSDNGQLNLGRTGALTNSEPNLLRGVWDADTLSAKDLTVKGTATGNDATETNEFTTLGQVNTALDLKANEADVYDKESSDARFLSETPGWWWQGSQVVTCPNSITTNLSGYATVSNGVIELVPYTTSKHTVTGAVELVSSSRYAVDVLSDAYECALDDPRAPSDPMGESYSWTRTSATSMVFKAWINSGDYTGNSYYYYALSNVVLRTYDRTDMSPNQYTNDTAGVLARVDDATGSDDREAVNYGTMTAYLESQKASISKAAYDYTPSGANTPDSNMFTVDEPLVQQGSITYLQSGDYYCQSYAGGDWYSSTTGSVWRIGPSGRVAFEIASTNRMLHVSGIDVDKSVGLVTLDISTNWVVSTPIIERSISLTNPQWLTCPNQTMVDNTSYWRGVCPTTYDRCFFRVVDPAGDNLIRSYHKHVFLGGIQIGTNTFSTLSELKTLLEALP